MADQKHPSADYANVPGGPEGLVELGKKYNLACKYPGCLCATKCLRRDEPFCDVCEAPVSFYCCDEGDCGYEDE